MENDQDRLSVPFGIADAVFLALVTAATYVAAYQFELGYCTYFSIPLEVIKLSVEVLLVAFVSVVAFLASFFYLLQFLLSITPTRFLERGNRARYIIFFNIGALILGRFAIWTSGFSWPVARTYLLVLLYIDLVILGVWLLVRYLKRHGKWPEKQMPEPLAETVATAKVDAYTLLYRVFDRRLVRVALVFFLVSNISNFAGNGFATNRVLFVRVDALDLIVLCRYGDTFVCKTNKPGTNQLDSGIRLVGLDELKTMHLSNRLFSEPPSLEEKYYGRK